MRRVKSPHYFVQKILYLLFNSPIDKKEDIYLRAMVELQRKEMDMQKKR